MRYNPSDDRLSFGPGKTTPGETEGGQNGSSSKPDLSY